MSAKNLMCVLVFRNSTLSYYLHLRKNRSELYCRAGQVARKGLYVGGSSAALLAIVHFDNMGEWVVPTWNVGLNEPNQVPCFQRDVRIVLLL